MHISENFEFIVNMPLNCDKRRGECHRDLCFISKVVQLLALQESKIPREGVS